MLNTVMENENTSFASSQPEIMISEKGLKY